MIPESILKKEKVSAKGDVTVNGNLKGLYGKGKMPLATLKIEINDASAQYAQLPYGIDELKANFFGQIDLMRQSPVLYLDLKIFHFKGAYTDILADAKVNESIRRSRYRVSYPIYDRPNGIGTNIPFTSWCEYRREIKCRHECALPFVIYQKERHRTNSGQRKNKYEQIGFTRQK